MPAERGEILVFKFVYTRHFLKIFWQPVDKFDTRVSQQLSSLDLGIGAFAASWNTHACAE